MCTIFNWKCEKIMVLAAEYRYDDSSKSIQPKIADVDK